MPADSSDSGKIRTEQVRLLYQQAPAALIATVVNSTLLSAVLWDQVSRTRIIFWYGLILLVSLGRFLLVRFYQKRNPDSFSPWEEWFATGVGVAGVSWGLAGILLFPENVVYQGFLAFVFGGMAAGAASSLSSVARMYPMFILLMDVPYALMLISQGGAIQVAMGLMAVVFTGLMLDISRRIYATIAASLKLRFENIELIRKNEAARLEAEKANKAKSVFLSRMSHEFRTPLNAILGFSQVMENDETAPLSSTQAEYMDHIQKAGWHLCDLIEETLDMSAIESGKIHLHMGKTLLLDAVEECASLVFLSAQKNRVSLHVECADTLHVMADKKRIKQILLNLLSNAVKYNREGGAVSVSCAENGDKVRISVRDTGKGMSAKQMEKLFQPYNRLGAEQSTVEGTGIGLVIARQLAELMGGSIGVQSEEGKGSVFWFELEKPEGAD